MAQYLVQTECGELRDRQQDGHCHKRLRTGIHAHRQRSAYRLVPPLQNLEDTKLGINLNR